MEMVTINVDLSVEVVDGSLLANLIFTNTATNQLLLDKYTICFDGKFRNNVFEINEIKGKQIGYSGMMIKRVLKPENFIEVKPGGVIKVTVNLNDAYKLILGKKYHIKFYAFNPRILENDPIMEMVSNTVTILYK